MKTNTPNLSASSMLLFKPRKKHLLRTSPGKALSSAIQVYKHTKEPVKAYHHRLTCSSGTMHIDTIIAAFLKSIAPPEKRSNMKNSA